MASSSSSNARVERNRNTFESESEPKEIEIQYEKLTETDLDELGVALETQPDGSLKIASPAQKYFQVDIWNKMRPVKCVNGIGTDDSELMRTMLHNAKALRLTVRCGSRNETRMSRS